MRTARTVEFRTIFLGLLLTAFVTAVMLPAKVGDRLRAFGTTAISPVSRPTHTLAAWVRTRWAIDPATRASRSHADAPLPPERLSPTALANENRRLRAELANAEGRLEAMAERARERERLGPIADRCITVAVLGRAVSRSATHDVLLIRSDLDPGPAVLTPEGLVGRIESPGRVRLLSDARSRFAAAFGRYDSDAEGARPSFRRLPIDPPAVRGVGDGKMEIERVRIDDVERAGVSVGDWLVLADRDWPSELRLYRAGTVSAIEPITSAPGFARVDVTPVQSAGVLREVMVFDPPAWATGPSTAATTSPMQQVFP